jgi:hypothetical protein
MTADPRADVNRRAAELFATIDDYDEQDFITGIDAWPPNCRPRTPTACSTAPAPGTPGGTRTRPSRSTARRSTSAA